MAGADGLTAVPSPAFQEDFEVDGDKTSLSVTIFADRVFVVLSQVPGIGSIIDCQGADPELGAEGRGAGPFTLVGDRRRDDALHVFARAYAQVVRRATGLPLLLSAALRGGDEPSPGLFRAVLARLPEAIKGAAAARRASMEGVTAALAPEDEAPAAGGSASGDAAAAAAAAAAAPAAAAACGGVTAEQATRETLMAAFSRGPRAGPASAKRD
ncbi:hypothetical protein FNF27_05692 [Cafeteria roenbergensis]|uniref:Proteasome assembly chaperone 3 n=1 Tax=Cafeteria roenbergensis TaxID=33653 RepID=A0A5A8EAA0_CAFRO|nr:hypothetical protein FNF31_06123 [Cafeteria roenbergensis]KAA0171310.1 hypothetical protein FNF28_00801 [Cafeteria roenbergensis]KAA0172831.1 hypothetical protein FNF27_05692 [Cafeteria roenbergensis]